MFECPYCGFIINSSEFCSNCDSGMDGNAWEAMTEELEYNHQIALSIFAHEEDEEE